MSAGSFAKDILSSLMVNLREEVYATMNDLGEEKEYYNLSVYPFTLSRIDGKEVPRDLLLALQQKFKN
jgi:hypothetical protein